jgi:hypothetical protein
MAERYNGWTNYETWCVNLWIDNEEHSQRYWQRQAEEALWAYEGPDDAVPILAEWLQDWHAEGKPKAEGVYGDLLRAALSEVNWHEIARHYIEAVQEESNA